MSRKPRVSDDSVPTGSNGVLFINYDLDDNTRAQYKAWREKNYEKLADFLDNAIDAGYQVSLKKDEYNACIGAFLIAKTTKTENDGFILTGRGSTAVTALFGVFFRHLVLFQQQWPTHNKRGPKLDDD